MGKRIKLKTEVGIHLTRQHQKRNYQSAIKRTTRAISVGRIKLLMVKLFREHTAAIFMIGFVPKTRKNYKSAENEAQLKSLIKRQVLKDEFVA